MTKKPVELEEVEITKPSPGGTTQDSGPPPPPPDPPPPAPPAPIGP